MLYRRTARLPRRIEAFMEFAEDAVRAFDPMGMTVEALNQSIATAKA
jgi:hypothetical protein